MHTSTLPLLTAPPLSFACAICGKKMKVISVELAVIDVAYVYQCPNGHQYEVITVGLR
jgi:hypothetical protein